MLRRRTLFSPPSLFRPASCDASSSSSSTFVFLSSAAGLRLASTKANTNNNDADDDSSSTRRKKKANDIDDGNSSNNSVLSSLVDPRIQKVTTYLQKNSPPPELVILVDGTAVLFRMCFAFRFGSASGNGGGLHIDPTSYIKHNLVKFLKLMHSIVPMGDPGTSSSSSTKDADADTSKNYQAPLIPPDVTVEAIKAGFLEVGAGLWVDRKGQQNRDNFRSMPEGGEKQQHPQQQQQPIVVETSESPGFLRRRVIVCFDYGTEHARLKYASDYKGDREGCGRIYSFLGLGTALARQLHSVGLIQAVFPKDLPRVEVDAHSPAPGSVQEWLDNEKQLQQQQQQEGVGGNNNNNNNNVIIDKKKNSKKGESTFEERMKNDRFVQSLLAGATTATTASLSTSAEADDVIATLATHFTKELNIPTVIASHDKDLLQLLELPKSYFFDTGKNRFISRRETCVKYGVESPKYLADYLTLVGDAADNVKGLPGTGDTKARAILQRFTSVDRLIDFAKSKKSDDPSFVLDKLKPDSQDVPPAAEGDGNKPKKQETASPSAKNKKKKKKEADDKTGGKYEATLLPLVLQHAERLHTIKYKVISLYHVPDALAVLKAELAREKNSDSTATSSSSSIDSSSSSRDPQTKKNKPGKVTKSTKQEPQDSFSSTAAVPFLTSPITFSSLPVSYWRGGAFVSRSGTMNEALFKRSSALWAQIRQFYVNKYGECNLEQQWRHKCGDRYADKPQRLIDEGEARKAERKKQIAEVREAKEVEKKQQQQQQLAEKRRQQASVKEQKTTGKKNDEQKKKDEKMSNKKTKQLSRSSSSSKSTKKEKKLQHNNKQPSAAVGTAVTKKTPTTRRGDGKSSVVGGVVNTTKPSQQQTADIRQQQQSKKQKKNAEGKTKKSSGKETTKPAQQQIPVAQQASPPSSASSSSPPKKKNVVSPEITTKKNNNKKKKTTPKQSEHATAATTATAAAALQEPDVAGVVVPDEVVDENLALFEASLSIRK